ncbi:NlpC/P60 family protein [Ancylomarina sp.]|uniref:NlpC/P60 family protein n=1 Tax=Ancylomarina sp. TaxID=1970196 RepID=UPI00356206F9
MLKQILFLILIAFAIASCSTNSKINKRTTSKHISKEAKEEKEKTKAKRKAEVQKPKKKISIKHKLETHYNKYKAVPYKYGGTSIKGFDCSGFVQFTYKNIFNISLPRTTRLMLKEGTAIKKTQLRIGDLVLFRTSKRYRHVGIFMGDNLFMHVSTKKGLMKSNLNNPYWLKHYLASRRIL